MSRFEAPEPWASAMRERGFTHHDRPSMTRLANEAGIGVQTVINTVAGRTAPDVETLEALASALHLDPRLVAQWVGVQREERRPWVPPAEANLLSVKERRALDALIRAIAERTSEPDVQSAAIAVSGTQTARGRYEGAADVVDENVHHETP